MHRVRPSSLHRTAACPGSLVMQERYPETERSEAAEIGTAAHWVGSECLQMRKDAGGAPVPPSLWIGSEAPNGVVVDEEMVEAVEVYVEAVSTVATAEDAWDQLQIEQPLEIPSIPECGGTPDARLVSNKRPRLFVWDYKHGHRYVEEYENPQLAPYMSGFLAETLRGFGVQDQDLAVEMTVVQPRAYGSGGPVRTWYERQGSNLRAFINTIANAVAQALGPDPQLVAGPQCFECSAAAHCPAANRQALTAMDYALQALPEELPASAVALELYYLERAQKALEARRTALETLAVAALKRGERVEGHGLQQKYGRLDWSRPAGEVKTLGDLYGVDVKKDALKTPKQAIAAGLPEDVVKAYSDRPAKGLALVADNPASIRKVFSNE